MNVNAPFSEESNCGGSHLVFDKFSEAVAELPQFFVEVLVLFFNQAIGFLKAPVCFLRAPVGFLGLFFEQAFGLLKAPFGFFLRFDEFAEELPNFLGGGGHDG